MECSYAELELSTQTFAQNGVHILLFVLYKDNEKHLGAYHSTMNYNYTKIEELAQYMTFEAFIVLKSYTLKSILYNSALAICACAYL